MDDKVGKVLQMFKSAARHRGVAPSPSDDLVKNCTDQATTVIIVQGDWVMCCEKKGQER